MTALCEGGIGPRQSMIDLEADAGMDALRGGGRLCDALLLTAARCRNRCAKST